MQCNGTRIRRAHLTLAGRLLRVDAVLDSKRGTIAIRLRKADGSILMEVKGREHDADDNAFLAVALDLLEEGDPAAALGRLADLLGEECAA